MCGFFAHIKRDDDSRLEELFSHIESTDLIKNRGPDEQRDLSLSNAYFFHSRLSLMGPFENGRQPYCGEENRENSEILLFNGSIYNYKSIDPTAKSDTEVLFKILRKRPLDLSQVNGAFCSSLYNPQTRRLLLLRDRIGIRPLFYVGLDDGGRVTDSIASEIIYSTNLLPIVEYLKKMGNFVEEDSQAYKEYFQFRFVRSPALTFFKGIKQLSPGCLIDWSFGEKIKEQAYWQLEDHLQSKNLSSMQFTEEANALLKSAISIRGESNTPICSFLSGGLDSGLITSVGLEAGFVKKSFHLSLPGETNETSRYLKYLEIYPHDHEIINFERPIELERELVLRKLEQPIGDSVVFLHDQLFKRSSKEFKIALSGDGADELFGGYIHHRLFQLVQLFHKLFPAVLRESLITLLSKLPLSFINIFFPYNDHIDQRGVLKLITFLRKFSKPFLAYSYLVSLTDIESDLLALDSLQDKWANLELEDFSIEKLIMFDLKFWGPGYSLFKIDRLSLSYGLEVRTPFYDHRLVELCLAQPFVSLSNIVKPKVDLQRLCKGLLNKRIIKQPKFPFRIKDHFLKETTDDSESKGLLKGKEQVSLLNYQDWKRSIS